MALPQVNAQPDTTDARRGWVMLATHTEPAPTRALIVGWVAIHRVYGEPNTGGWAWGHYRLTHIPSGYAICDVAEAKINIPYAIATLFVRELPTAPVPGTLGYERLGELVTECAVPWMVMRPQDGYMTLDWTTTKVVAS
jgi:hypothetical protein